ncbi:hypothetical protein A2833_02285 [Candidatus Azambacteria bacterium RIFCSPHIGHO2_01_FULL_44_55]|uniref:AAA+ ATPase domain-containing protein n=1 Tax=Candidatus Azambacteria bacterium RIFCSPLOWO2_02_FULL_44_14 TaxID=1797306 RepID=A0A1F5CAW7_9BACT|nr:MAG: hypothetical protein A3A18_00460 [Candidatus Azambacteria bacterium RIFCSPLOWO2_01_FULL_44_84]OGD33603.1 MAG: hypothetical protein A3C78_00495 [Candidatus Azambacteria bacterium RIFCSPHIGHO2_02_FULL_45_18]OGD40026.1 MAG: hypothetical protein A3I30_00235 [Candidatus Azambacteria bacterium RIFCSPLOWO2_02_FULL_44_14]OGD40907.1 MAG: hypothetical protein A2833_02285 [Candidatus Azambacteria bacterium RIFCSPHIGHO2_01_FULL_44_55]OGD51639.1 MAG: hypothetical protein A2608_01665 [Candidatus Azam
MPDNNQNQTAAIPEKISPDVLILIPEDSARFYKMAPFDLLGKVLQVGMVDPTDVKAQEALNFLVSQLGLIVKILKISETDWQRAMEQYKGIKQEVSQALEELERGLTKEKLTLGEEVDAGKKETEIDAPIIRVVTTIIKNGVEFRASDIHIEPSFEKVRIRYRIDGVLATALTLPLSVHQAVISRVKILSNLRIDERRVPQDGRFRSRLGDKEVDFRVSTFPTAAGEKVALRILDTSQGVRTLPDLGVMGRNLETMKEAIHKPFGLIFITGPTGSGKSTTIYSILKILNTDGVNIVTLEDPVEYYIEWVNQSQIRPEIGYTFGSGLRQILRQDPNVIVVGEVRDNETATLSIHAALTGHIVLSTLHTNNAIGAIPRLIDMGVEPFLIPSSLNLVAAQRLVKKLCPDCRKEVAAPERAKEIITNAIASMPEGIKKDLKVKDPIKIYEPQGCPQCNDKGTRGRIAVFEILAMTSELSQIIASGVSEDKLVAEAKRQNMITMFQDGILKVLDGIIGLEELIHVVSVEDVEAKIKK